MTTTITTDPGTIAVPMSSILDALEGVLTEAEQTALFGQLIGLRPAGVAPGDLITAELFNGILNNINDLLVRVAVLEGAAGGPIIDELDPESQVAVHSHLTVTGRNFDPEPRLNIVRIGDVEIDQFRIESSPTHLIFAVPDLFSGLPASFPVRVETGGRTSNAMSITIKEQDQVQQGNFLFQNTVSPAGAITVGATLSFSWTVQAVTVFDDNIALSLLVGNPVGATTAAWQSTANIQPTSPMAIAAGQTKTVTVTVQVPAGATSAQLGLKAVSEDGGVTNASDPVAVTVGQPVEVSDPRIDLIFRIPALGGGGMVQGPVDVGGGPVPGVHVKAGGNGKLIFTAEDKRPQGGTTANFQYSAEILAPANGLAVGALNPVSVTGVAAGDDRSFDLPLTAPLGATINATAQLKVTCTQTKTTGGLTNYKAFRTIPLRIIS